MKREFVTRFFSTVAAAAMLCGGVASAQQGYGSVGGEFIVASKVVSDTKAQPASYQASGYAGDLAQTSGSCDSGDCGGNCDGGGCESGDCGNGKCRDDKGRGGLLGKLGSGDGLLGGLGNGGGLLGGRGNRGERASMGCVGRQYDHTDLFYNYFSKGNCNQANAQLYVSPMPVPPFVGHTFYTYQPFYPHHYMYRHSERFHNNYDNGRGMNRTRVSYSYPMVRTALSSVYWNKIRLPR